MSTPLFSPLLLPGSTTTNLPENYTLRPLDRSDYAKGFFTCLRALTWTGEISERQFQDQFDWMQSHGSQWFYNLVIEHEGKIVANGVLIFERKFIWGLGSTGHIEDISIRKEYQGQGLGKIMVVALHALAKELGANKTMLDCSPENERFYQKCGFVADGSLHMGQKIGLTAEDVPEAEK